MAEACPKCGSTKIENDECLHCGIFVSKYVAYLQKRGLTAELSPTAAAVAATVQAPATPREMDEIEYRIVGDDIQVVEIALEPGRAAIAEPAAMLYMEADVTLDTVVGDGSSGADSVLGKIAGAGSRVLTGESLFTTVFTNAGTVTRRVAFAAANLGKIHAVRLSDVGGELLAQKGAFLAAARGVSIHIAFQKKLGAALLGGEGFILQSLQGAGMVFVSGAGAVQEYALAARETLRVQAGCIVAFERSVLYNVEYVGSIKSALFSGQGLAFAMLTGPGRVWLQSPAGMRTAAPAKTAAGDAASSVGAAVGAGVVGRVFSGSTGSRDDSESESGDGGSGILGALGSLLGSGDSEKSDE